MRTRSAWGVALVGVALLLAGPIAAEEEEQPEETPITGRLLDESGEPVANTRVSWGWLSDGEGWTTRTGVRTDEEGTFSIHPRYARARTLMAFDETGERAAIVTPGTDSEGPVVLTFGPTTLVTAAYTSTELGFPLEKLYASFTALPARIAVGSHRGGPSFSLRLPPGEYVVTISGEDCRRIRQRITLTEDMRVVDLGTTDLEPTIIAQHYGLEPPAWHVTDARGVEPDVTLADFRGKWVLLEFWGFW
jgi:hypothetical protein